jgi:hypothetical protein
MRLKVQPGGSARLQFFGHIFESDHDNLVYLKYDVRFDWIKVSGNLEGVERY